MSTLVSRDITSNESTAIPCARLQGAGWYIEVSKVDECTISIRCAGNVAGSGVLRIVPNCANGIYVTNEVEFERRVYDKVHKILEVHEQNARVLRKRGIKEV